MMKAMEVAKIKEEWPDDFEETEKGYNREERRIIAKAIAQQRRREERKLRRLASGSA